MIGFLAERAATSADSTGQVVGYPSLFLLVALGSLVPVVPTGALVSGAAAVAFHHQNPPVALALVFVTASLAAFIGDMSLYWLGHRGVHSRNGSRWLKRLQDRAEPGRLEAAQHKLDQHGIAVLVLSRLVPAGRIPVMVACLLSELPPARFARGDIPACLAWALAYQLIGVLGGSLFAEPWEGVILAVGLTLAIAVAPQVWRWLVTVTRRQTVR